MKKILFLLSKIMHARFSSDFRGRVLAVVKNIPPGKTMSYKGVAAQAGNASAARAVGAIMSANTNKSVPCHRVIRSDGKPGGYNGLLGINDKIALLKKEGVIF